MDRKCEKCNGLGGEIWHEADGSERGERCDVCDGFGNVTKMELGTGKARLIEVALELMEALEAVVRVADRATVEFDSARAAISNARAIKNFNEPISKSADELAYENTGLKMELFHMQERMGYMQDTINILKSIPNPPRWKPIESAPKNEPILVFAGGQQFVAWFQDDATDPWHEEEEGESHLNGAWCVTDNKIGPFALRGSRPTHWMPLPPPPEVEG